MPSPKLVIGRVCMTLLVFSSAVRTSSQVIDTSTIHEKNFLKQEIDSLPVSEKNRYAPGIISTVSYDMTKKFGWFSTNDILYSLPGFTPSQDYDRRTVSFRGMYEGWNNNHLLMLMDGIPFNDNLYGSAYTWENTPLIFSKSYEITRGPEGTLYGNNAMNGVIAFNTVEAPDLKGIGNVRLRFGSNNTQITDILSGAENKSAGIVASFTHYSTDGNAYNSYDLSGRMLSGGSPQQFKVRDEQDNHYIFVKAYGKGKYKGLSLQYHEQHWGFQTGHGWLFSVPDLPEAMSEYRRLLAFKYAPYDENKKFNYELSARYQDHGIDWNMRFFPDNSSAYGTNFPNGVSELLKTSAKDIFFRFRGSYNNRQHQVTFGLEGNYFTYGGDKFHTSNIDLNNGTAPDSLNHVYLLNPWLEYIEDKPVKNIALLGRYISPKFFRKLQFNVSARYDNQFFTYTAINQQGRPEKNKSFTLFSPGASLVFTTGDVVWKAIASRAFRTPSPTEMFGANTFTLASNINQLKAEIVTNYDFSFDWKLSKSLYFRANWFLINFRNQIAYSVANANLSTNIYTLKTTGIETELNFNIKRFSGFFNYSYNKRIDEAIADSTVAISSNKTTWAPANVANLGIIYSARHFYTSLALHYQGKVHRRVTDIIPEYERYRPSEVAAWVGLDGKIAYKIKSFAEIGVVVKNLTNETQYLIKNNAAPFDYRRELRRVFVDINIRF
jgi:outer membrane receptor protein involved in Fe transport